MTTSSVCCGRSRLAASHQCAQAVSTVHISLLLKYYHSDIYNMGHARTTSINFSRIFRCVDTSLRYIFCGTCSRRATETPQKAGQQRVFVHLSSPSPHHRLHHRPAPAPNGSHTSTSTPMKFCILTITKPFMRHRIGTIIDSVCLGSKCASFPHYQHNTRFSLTY